MANKTYVVKAGDSLGKIAKEFYGDAKRWKEIYEANKGKIKNPDVIQAGLELVIPGVAEAFSAEGMKLADKMGKGQRPLDADADAESKVGGPKRV